VALIQRRLEVVVLIEDTEENIDRTYGFTKVSLKNSCRNLKGGAVALGLYDESGRVVGLDITGNPSAEMSEVLNEIFEDEEEESIPTSGKA
jgi:hypothetical protein